MHIAGLPDVRSYSLVGDRPVDGAYRIAVKRLADSRGGSEHIHSLAPGAELSISEPRSHFELQYGRPEYLLVAGGIGVTPIVGMAHALARHGRPFRLLYAARSRAQMAFAEGSRSCSAIVWSCSRPPKATGSTSPPRSAGSIATASCTSAGRCGSWTRLARRGQHRTGR
jgi:ferredoxin-NADP reductase